MAEARPRRLAGGTHVAEAMCQPEVPSFPWRSALETAAIDLSIVIPCYNEQDNVVPTIENVVTAMREIGCKYEIIIVDDCSTDQTFARVNEFRDANPQVPLRLHRNRANRGFARTFFDGAFMARGQFFRLICGDNVESIENIVAVARHMGDKDMVLPYHSAAYGRSGVRLALSSWFTWLVNLMSGRNIRYYNGCGLFRTFDVMRWHVETTGFGFQAEFVTRMLDLGATYVEVPVVARERQTGISRALTRRNFMSAAYTFLKIGLRRLRRKIFKDERIDLR